MVGGKRNEKEEEEVLAHHRLGQRPRLASFRQSQGLSTSKRLNLLLWPIPERKRRHRSPPTSRPNPRPCPLRRPLRITPRTLGLSGGGQGAKRKIPKCKRWRRSPPTPRPNPRPSPPRRPHRITPRPLGLGGGGQGAKKKEKKIGGGAPAKKQKKN